MAHQYDIFDNLNSYLDKSDDCDIPDDAVGENLDEEYDSLDEESKKVDITSKKQSRKKKLSVDEEEIPVKKASPNKKTEQTVEECEDSDELPSSSSYSSIRSSGSRSAVPKTVNLDDDLEQQLKDVQTQYDIIFNKNSSFTNADKRYFASLKKQYQALMKKRLAPTRRSARGRQNTFIQSLESLKEIFYNICVNHNLMAPAPAPSFTAPEPDLNNQRRRSRRHRHLEPELVNLVDSPPLILPGTINLDSDEEDTVADKSENLSFDSENYEISLKVKWQGHIQRFTHRKYQKFGDLINLLAEKANANPSCVILDLNERIIDPNDTPDTIGYKISQFICGRVVEGKLADIFTAKQTTSTVACKNSITLKVQSDRWKQPLEVSIEKSQNMRVVVIKCAEELKCNPSQFKLSFDGDPVEMDSTPQDLDLEGGEILDLRFVK